MGDRNLFPHALRLTPNNTQRLEGVVLHRPELRDRGLGDRNLCCSGFRISGPDCRTCALPHSLDSGNSESAVEGVVVHRPGLRDLGLGVRNLFPRALSSIPEREFL